MSRSVISLLVVAFLIPALGVGCASAPSTGPSQADLDGCTEQLSAAQAELADVRGDLSFLETRLAAYQRLIGKLRAAFDAEGLTLVVRNGLLVLQLPNDVLFASGQASLTETGTQTLSKVAGVLKAEAARRFVVAGHTDNVPVKAKNAGLKSNWQLSQMRALAATEHLIAGGVAPTQLSAAGYGEFLPVGTNATDAGKAKNRRIEIIFMPTVDEIPEIPDDIIVSPATPLR